MMLLLPFFLFLFQLRIAMLNKIMMPHPFLILSQSDYLSLIVDSNSHS